MGHYLNELKNPETRQSVSRKHKCKELTYCIYSSQALEPDEDCPIHGWPSEPPRCGCGKFVKRNKNEMD